MLWVDKHRPTSLEKLDVHPELTNRLVAMSEDGEIPHLLFYGPAGSGKKTRVLALLKRIFGPGAERVRLEHRTFKTPSGRAVELTTVASNYHIEMSPADAGIYDRYIVQICQVLSSVCRKEGLTLPPELAARLAKSSNRNLRRAVLMLEACKVQQYPFTPDQTVQLTDWENYIAQLTREIVIEQSPKRLLEAREKLYELLTNCIPADIILKTLTRELMTVIDDCIKTEVLHWAAFYEHRLHLGSKEILHLEAFIAKFMSIYKTYIIKS